MADVKISALPVAGAIVPSTNVLPVVNGGITAKATVSTLVNSVLSASPTISGGTINNTTIGASTASSGKFTTIDATTGLTINGDQGTTTQVLTSNGSGTAPTWQSGPLPSITAVATGSIATGSAVIVNTDGTVSQVAGTASVVGASTSWGSNTNKQFQGVYDSGTSQVVVVYQESLNHYVQVVTGTISGTTITFGTPVTVATGDLDDLTFPTICLAGTSKVVITYSPTSDGELRAVAGTVSAGTVTLGTPILVDAVNATSQAVAASIYDTTNSRVIVGYQTTSAGVRAAAISLSGLALTSSTSAQLSTSTTTDLTVGLSSTNKLVFFYQNDVTASLTIATAATGVVVAQAPINIPGFNLSSNTFATTVLNDDDLFVTFVETTTGSLTSVVVIIDYTGNTATTGNRQVIDTGPATGRNAVTVSKYPNGQLNVNYESLALAKLRATKIQVIEAVIKIDGIRTLVANAFATYIATFPTSNPLQSVVLYFSSLNAQEYLLFTASSTNLVDVNFIGFSAGTYTNGQTAIVKTIGNKAIGLSGLSPSIQYFVTETGDLSVIPSIPSVIAGVALTATTLLIKG